MGLRRFSTVLAAAAVVAAAALSVAATPTAPTTGVLPSPPEVAIPTRAATPARAGRLRGGRVVKSAADIGGSLFLVRLFSPDGKRLLCTGTLISGRHVLTSASCGISTNSTARVGGFGLYDGYFLRIASVTPCPWYAPVGRLADAAVVTLDAAPTVATWAARGVVPAVLPPSKWVPDTLRVSGWGGTSADGSGTTWGGASPNLRTGIMPVTPWEVCEAVLMGQTRLRPASQICANFESLEDTALCTLDTGGPLWERRLVGEKAVHVVYGVASYWALPEGKAEACPLAELTLFAKVHPLSGWVCKMMAADGA